MTEIDFSKMKERLMPALIEPEKEKPNAVVAALLLATGRRTIEVLKTGSLTLSEEMTMDGYEAVFAGQAKDSLFGTDPYPIPLLAPFRLVHAALKVVREALPVDGMDNEQVTAKYSRKLDMFVAKRVGITPHTLRSVYAMATYELFNNKKISLIGWVSRVLGHSKVSNAAFYTTTKIIEPSVFTPPTGQEGEEIKEEEDGWVTNNKPERKRVDAIKEMMLKGIKITANSVRTHSGGTMVVIARVIEKNQERIDAYNENLQKE